MAKQAGRFVKCIPESHNDKFSSLLIIEKFISLVSIQFKISSLEASTYLHLQIFSA